MAETLRDDLVRLTCDLIAIPSVAERPDDLRAAISYAERYARAVPGVFVERGEHGGKPYVVATLRETRTPAIMLNAHLDVVPARPEQFAPELRDGRIYGRGSQDMKGSAAVLLRLLRDLAALPERPDVGFMFVSDEEIGGELGTGYLAEQGWGCDIFLAAEPTDMQVLFQHKGVLWIQIKLNGQPCHGARPWEGRNAMALLRDGLAAMERRFPTPDEAAWVTTVVPTLVQGGEASNRLPESVTLTLDVRNIPDDTPDQIMAGLQEAFPGGQVELVRSGPPLATAPDDALVQRLGAAVGATLGQPARYIREHFATDARFYSERGIAAVCLGPVGAGLHTDDEWVEAASLEDLYQALRRFALA
jgi:succinyl-diaminopimelate desuccinylase